MEKEDWLSIWERRKQSIYTGKKLFEDRVDIQTMSENDAILLLLTQNEECISAAAKYLPLYQKQFRKSRIHIFAASTDESIRFDGEGINFYLLSEEELDNLATYCSIFDLRNGIIYMCETDKWGAKVEYLINNHFFSIDEYVALGVYELKSYL